MHENQIGTVIPDCAVHLHRDLGPGLLETVYEATFARKLEKRGLSVQRQVPIAVENEGPRIDEGRRCHHDEYEWCVVLFNVYSHWAACPLHLVVMPQYEILPGLPPYGPEAFPFSATGMGTHSEGFVVRFLPDTESSWVGNFQPGLTDMHGVTPHPDNERLIVISGGEAYVIDPAEPAKWSHFGGSINFVEPVPDLNAILLGNGLWFELLGSESTIWQTRRISWDGMRDLTLQGLALTGRSWCHDDTWSDFTVDLVEGTVVGGSYNGPDSPECAT